MKEWAVYQGDNFLFFGKTREVAERLGVSQNTVYFYSTPAYQRRLDKTPERYPEQIHLVDVSDVD